MKKIVIIIVPLLSITLISGKAVLDCSSYEDEIRELKKEIKELRDDLRKEATAARDARKEAREYHRALLQGTGK